MLRSIGFNQAKKISENHIKGSRKYIHQQPEPIGAQFCKVGASAFFSKFFAQGFSSICAVFTALAVFSLAACTPNGSTGTNSSADSSRGSGDKPVVYTSFFPVYDLTKRVVGDKMDVRSIISGAEEAHDFELKPNDMGEISKAQLIIYNGAGMETFIDDLKSAAKDDNKFIDLSQGLTLLKSKGAGEGASDDASESGSDDQHGDSDAGTAPHKHTEGDDHQHDNHSAVNPHTWLSVKNAQKQVSTIAEAVSALDPDNAQFYQENSEQTQAELKKLDKKFEESLAKIPAQKRYFVVSHAAFNYLAHDYGLRQVAVTGISPSEEPTAAQLATISDFVRKHEISTIFFEGKATPKVAQTLARETGVETSSIYTLESVSDEERDLGYITLMERNLDALVKAFNA